MPWLHSDEAEGNNLIWLCDFFGEKNYKKDVHLDNSLQCW